MIDPSPSPPPFTYYRGGLGSRSAIPAALRAAVVAIGNFEGVHRGHRAVIGAAKARAGALGRPTAVLTFAPHPRTFFNPASPVFRLGDLDTKLRLLSATGIDGAIVLEFDTALAALDAGAFVDKVLVERLSIAGAVVGHDFHFGRGREGTPEFLAAAGRRHGFAVDVVAPFADGERRVSSGLIRASLAAGEVAEAARLLGNPWFITGKVVHGDKRGRELGYPTANIRLDPDAGPRFGVYAVRVAIGDRLHDGVANFGRRPMFDTGAVLLEVFVFDFDGDLYGQSIDVAFIGWIRQEMKFESVDGLVRRMDEDSRLARTILARTPPVALPPRLGQARPVRQG